LNIKNSIEHKGGENHNCSPEIKKYEIHVNGGRPFEVTVNSKTKKLIISVEDGNFEKYDKDGNTHIEWKSNGYKKMERI